MAEPDGVRSARLAVRLREEISTLLLHGAVKDPGARHALISGVEVSNDLRYARVFVRSVIELGSEPERARLVRAMERASGFIRRRLAARLALRHTPELRFSWDASTDRANRMERILAEIRAEAEPPGDDGSGGP